MLRRIRRAPDKGLRRADRAGHRTRGRVDEQFFRDRRTKRLGVLKQDLPELDYAVGRCAIDERARHVHRARLVVSAPAADRIEVLQRIAKRKEVPVAVDAGLGGQSARLGGDRQLGLHGLGAGKSIRQRRAEEVEANPLRSCRGRRVGGVDAVLVSRRHHQDAAVAEKPGPFRRGHGHAAELRAGDVGDAVVRGELRVEERVVRAPEVERVAVVTQLTEQEQLGFPGEGIAQGDVVVGEVLLVRIGVAELVELAATGRRSATRRRGRDRRRASGGSGAREPRGRSSGCAAPLRSSAASGSLFQRMVASRVAISWLLAAAGGFASAPRACSIEREHGVDRRSIGPARTRRAAWRPPEAGGRLATTRPGSRRSAPRRTGRAGLPDGDRMRPLWQPAQ